VPANEVVYQETHGDLSLSIGPPVDGSLNNTVFEVGNHLSEQVCGDYLDLAGKAKDV